MRELLGVAVAAALSSTAVACALVARDVSLPRSPNGVSVAFDHLGLAANPLDARIANTEPSKAAQLPGSDYWFRVRNGSGEAISITAFGMYFKLPFEWYSLPDGTRVLSVEDGADVSVVFERRRPNGRVEHYAGPIDVFGSAILPPGHSVIFSVPRNALPRRWAVCVPYEVFGAQGKRSERVCHESPSELPPSKPLQPTSGKQVG